MKSPYLLSPKCTDFVSVRGFVEIIATYFFPVFEEGRILTLYFMSVVDTAGILRRPNKRKKVLEPCRCRDKGDGCCVKDYCPCRKAGFYCGAACRCAMGCGCGNRCPEGEIVLTHEELDMIENLLQNLDVELLMKDFCSDSKTHPVEQQTK